MEVKEYLKEFGYKDKEINNIVASFGINNLKLETLLIHIKEVLKMFTNYGLSNEQTIRITKTFPYIFALDVNSMNELIYEYKEYGFVDDEIIKIIKGFPKIFSYGKENRKNHMNYLSAIGFSKEDIIKLIVAFPQIFSININTLNNKINYFVSLGIDIPNIIKMVKSSPEIFSYNNDTILNKIENLINLGYTKSEAINITIEFPSLLGLNEKTIEEKINFYKSINLEKAFIKKPKYLMQSIPLSYARYNYFKEKNHEINMDNFSLLFLTEKNFVSKYKITNEELKNIYNYDKEKKNEKSI